MAVIFEPAAAVAAGICLVAREFNDGRDRRHPRPCGWCDYPLEVLRSMVDGFNAWAGFDERKGTYTRFEARQFQGLPHRQQSELVLEAQSFPDYGSGDPQPDVAAAAADPAEEPVWVL